LQWSWQERKRYNPTPHKTKQNKADPKFVHDLKFVALLEEIHKIRKKENEQTWCLADIGMGVKNFAVMEETMHMHMRTVFTCARAAVLSSAAVTQVVCCASRSFSLYTTLPNWSTAFTNALMENFFRWSNILQTQMQKYITSQGKKIHVGVSSLPAQTKMSNANGLVKQVASQSQRKNIQKQPKKHKELRTTRHAYSSFWSFSRYEDSQYSAAE
jgi:hypothetical protein